jgi:hypothetical protein
VKDSIGSSGLDEGSAAGVVMSDVVVDFANQVTHAADEPAADRLLADQSAARGQHGSFPTLPTYLGPTTAAAGGLYREDPADHQLSRTAFGRPPAIPGRPRRRPFPELSTQAAT